MDIGESPALDVAVGNQLDENGLRKLFEKDNKWIGDNSGVIPGGTTLVLSALQDGRLTLSAGEGLGYKGKWWISGDKFYFNILGISGYFYIVKNSDVIKLYDPTSTLFGKFHSVRN